HDLLSEGTIDFTEAAKSLRDSSGRAPHLASIRRWAKVGCRGHRLETVFVGGRLLTTRAAIHRFLAAINGHAAPAPATPTSAAERLEPHPRGVTRPYARRVVTNPYSPDRASPSGVSAAARGAVVPVATSGPG